MNNCEINWNHFFLSLFTCLTWSNWGDGIGFRMESCSNVIQNWFNLNLNYIDRKPVSKQEADLWLASSIAAAVWCSPFCRLPWEASRELLLKLMFAVCSQLLFAAALWSASVSAPTHSADADVSFRAQSSMIWSKIMGFDIVLSYAKSDSRLSPVFDWATNRATCLLLVSMVPLGGFPFRKNLNKRSGKLKSMKFLDYFPPRYSAVEHESKVA